MNFADDKIYCHFQGSGNLDAIQIIKKLGGNLIDSYLDEGNGIFVRLNIVDYKTIFKHTLIIVVNLKLMQVS